MIRDGVVGVLIGLALVTLVIVAVLQAMPLLWQDDSKDQLRRVTVDGQECVVVERRFGRIEAVTCDWMGR